IGVVAQATTGEAALLCGDAAGFAPVVRRGDPRPDGRRFYTVETCDFGASDQLVFVGTSLAPSGQARTYFRQAAVYRPRPDRLERVLGPGDVLTDGTTITALPSEWMSVFEADPSGRLLIMAATSQHLALLIVSPAGTIERVPLRLRNYAYPTETVTFDPHSSIDHEYLSGITSEPRPQGAAPTAAESGGEVPSAPATLAPRTNTSDDPYYDPDAVWVSYAHLAASGGVFVLGDQAVPDPEFEV